MKKLPLIVFSGGLDSSYMLYRKLEEGDVHTCYIKASQSPVKIPLELNARKKVIAFFEEKTGHKVLSDSIVNLGQVVTVNTENRVTGTDTYDTAVPDVAWGQAHLWLSGLLRVSDGRIHSEVCLGNIMGDQISQCFHNMKEAWHHLQAFTKQNPIPLEFPLALITKDLILQEMPMEILPHLWVCDLPDTLMGQSVPCGNCQSCNTMRKTIFHWEFVNDKDFRKHVEEHIQLLAKLREGREKETHPEVEVVVDQSMKDVDISELIELRNPTIDVTSGIQIDVHKVGSGQIVKLADLSVVGSTGLPDENKEHTDEQARIATNSTKPHHLTQCV